MRMVRGCRVWVVLSIYIYKCSQMLDVAYFLSLLYSMYMGLKNENLLIPRIFEDSFQSTCSCVISLLMYENKLAKQNLHTTVYEALKLKQIMNNQIVYRKLEK